MHYTIQSTDICYTSATFKAPDFNGEGDVETFLQQFQEVANNLLMQQLRNKGKEGFDTNQL